MHGSITDVHRTVFRHAFPAEVVQTLGDPEELVSRLLVKTNVTLVFAAHELLPLLLAIISGMKRHHGAKPNQDVEFLSISAAQLKSKTRPR